MFDNEPMVDARQTAELVAASHAALVEQEARLVLLAAHWADLHSAVAAPDRPGGERLRPHGGAGTPEVSEFAAAELGLLQHTTTTAAAYQMADALDLRHRHPRLWALLMRGGVRAWKARAVAKATRHLSLEAAGRVDDAVVGHISTLAWGRFELLLAGRIIEADPAEAARRQEVYDADRFVRAGRSNEHGLKVLIAKANAGDVIWFMAMVDRIAELLAADGDLDLVDIRRSKAIGILAQPAVALDLLQRHHQPDAEGALEADADDQHTSVVIGRAPRLTPADLKRVAPPVTLYLHLSAEAVTAGTGVARMETVGPVLLSQLADLLPGTQITVRPVVDPDLSPADAYEIPHRLREHVMLSHPYDVFPYGLAESRHLDLDHTEPYTACGPPGQTRLDNLGPLARHNHRIKTHSRWSLRQPSAGVYLWRSPHGWVSIVTNQGTLTVGDGDFAQTLWRTAAPLARPDPTPPTQDDYVPVA